MLKVEIISSQSKNSSEQEIPENFANLVKSCVNGAWSEVCFTTDAFSNFDSPCE